MVFDAVDHKQNTTESANNASNIFVKSLIAIVRYQRFSILRRKNDVIDQICVRSGHMLCRPLRGLCSCCFISTGLHPWLYARHPLRGLRINRILASYYYIRNCWRDSLFGKFKVDQAEVLSRRTPFSSQRAGFSDHRGRF